jgi:uncharacterized membrane protein
MEVAGRTLVSVTFFSGSEVTFMLNGILAVISAIIAGFSFYKYTQSDDNKLYLVMFIVFLLAFLGLGAMFLSGRVNKTEDIHITE